MQILSQHVTGFPYRGEQTITVLSSTRITLFTRSCFPVRRTGFPVRGTGAPNFNDPGAGTPMLAFSQAAENNKQPIMQELGNWFAACHTVLEIGSGTGQHAVFFTQNLPHLIWQPTELPGALAPLAARISAQAPANLRPPLALDVCAADWALPKPCYDGIFSANCLHIMAWPEVICLFAGIGNVLSDDGIVCIYGPFRYDGTYTSDSNARFDDWLRQRDGESGIRDFEAVDALAQQAGLGLSADVAMPANNQLLVWRKTAQAVAHP